MMPANMPGLRSTALRLPLLASVFGMALCLQGIRPAAAQTDQPALLIADQVLVEGETRLIATGNVEALYDGTRLQARQITYDRVNDRLDIIGPIRLTDSQGNILTAERGALDTDLENGLLIGARGVLDQQLQLAAAQAERQGRYTQLSKVAVTSCQVCGQSGVPLWQIRADRVVHDTEENQLYFDKAQLRILDVPVAYIPRLRLPDPTVDRARGLLVPSLRTTSLLGTGIKVPYFIPIGDHRDVTLTPYLSPSTRTLELTYRQAFANGDLEVNGAVSEDSLLDGALRQYIDVEGAFDLPRDFKLEFDIEAVSDDSYLNDYDYLDGKERLDSALSVTRARRDELIFGQIVHYESLRSSEDNATQPTIIADVTYEKRIFRDDLPGELRFEAETHGHSRYSDLPYDSNDDDLVVDGRDVARVNLDVSWRNIWTSPIGLQAGVESHLWFDRYATYQDDTSEPDVASASAGLRAELRWPWSRRGPSGGTTLIEPIVQVGWVGGEREGNPNDESTRVEFDEGNLLSLNRYPAADRRELGLQTAAGLRFSHRDRTGRVGAFTLARLWRQDADEDLTLSSGLQNTTSDWLIAMRYETPDGFSLFARGLSDDNFTFPKAQARAAWSNDRIDLGASYLLLAEDEDEDRDDPESEWALDIAYQVSDFWTVSTEFQFDVADDRLDQAGLGLQYENECVEVTFSVTREYASAENLDPSTDLDLTLSLKGFSTGNSAKEYRRTCHN